MFIPSVVILPIFRFLLSYLVERWARMLKLELWCYDG